MSCIYGNIYEAEDILLFYFAFSILSIMSGLKHDYIFFNCNTIKIGMFNINAVTHNALKK